MKKSVNIFLSVFVMALLFIPIASLSASASEQLYVPKSEITVEIVSPDKIESKPIYEGDIEIFVTNTSSVSVDNLACYLTIVDVDRQQTYPVDEFGENAYQTREIKHLEPSQQITIKIPVRILYVGNFRFTASVINLNSGVVYTGNALNVNILSDSKMNKSLVTGVAVAVPCLLTVIVLVASRKRLKGHKKTK